MKMIIETFITILFLTVAVIVSTQLIGSQIIINNANDFLINAVQAIEESNFSGDVIMAYTEEAEKLGYTLEVIIEEEIALHCVSCNNMWTSNGEERCPECGSESIYSSNTGHEGEVTLEYNVDLAFLGISKVGKLEANAR